MTFEYEGTDLEAMGFAENYHRWIIGDVQNYLGKRVLEVGSGSGSFSKLLLETDLEFLLAIEPSGAMFEQLKAEIGRDPSDGRVQFLNGSLHQVSDGLAAGTFDSVLYINVLEHIEDDLAELARARPLLRQGGALIIYVPALPGLFGPFDKRVGHHRRYTDERLSDLVAEAGFRIISSTYRDLAGVVPWWFQARVLKSEALSPGSVRLYDKLIPLVRLIDRITGPPVGKNLLLVAEPIRRYEEKS